MGCEVWGVRLEVGCKGMRQYLLGGGKGGVFGVELATGDLLELAAAEGAANRGEALKEVDAIQVIDLVLHNAGKKSIDFHDMFLHVGIVEAHLDGTCLLYTSDAADE